MVIIQKANKELLFLVNSISDKIDWQMFLAGGHGVGFDVKEDYEKITKWLAETKNTGTKEEPKLELVGNTVIVKDGEVALFGPDAAEDAEPVDVIKGIPVVIH